MFWVNTVGSKIIGFIEDDYGVKINEEIYFKFLEKTRFEWYMSQLRSFMLKRIFMNSIAFHKFDD